jgi:peptidoglycan/LPS O-acetylase OafA/YrhL
LTGDAGPGIRVSVPQFHARSTTASNSKDTRYLPALTGLRFVLALWVILHHITGKGMMLEQWEQTLPQAVQSILRGGYLAVQTFFVLSGFVLARTYASTRWNQQSLIRFGMARFARIYPVYLFSLLVVSRFILETLAKPGRTFAQKAALLGDYGFVLMGWMGSLSVGWNTPAWSLSCEIFFYLCFPLLFILLRKESLPRLLAAFGVSLAVPIFLQHAGVPAVWKPIHHLSDFLAGIAAAGLFQILGRSAPSLRRRGFLLYLPAIAIGAAFITHQSILRGTLADINTVLRPLNVALIVGLGFAGGFLARVLSARPVEYLGKASYSMYILHVPVLWWFSRYALHLIGPAPHLWNALAFLVCVVVVSIAAFELVEGPANNRIRDWTAARLQGSRELRASANQFPHRASGLASQ